MLKDATDGKPEPPMGGLHTDATTVEVQVVCVCVALIVRRATPAVAARARIAQYPSVEVTKPRRG
jgi:hypothetical protein